MTRDSVNVTKEWVAEASAHESELGEILDRYVTALEQGSPLDVERLAAAHPHLAAEIKSCTESLHLLHHVAGRLRIDKDGKSPPSDVGPRALGDFEISREIGRGGMGVVYEARQISLGRQVALKVLPFAAVLDQKQIARFRNEAQAAAQLHHPNIVPVFAVGQERGIHYYAMQLIQGQSLDEALRAMRGADAEPRDGADIAGKGAALVSTAHGASTWQDSEFHAAFSVSGSARSRGYCEAVCRLGIEAAEALHFAHEYGIVHRDVKPSNLLLDRTGKLWVTDFGLARIQDNPGVTMTGDVVGTLRYMSPEQAGGQQALVDARSDVCSLGATLYELLTLEPAHPGEDRRELLRQIADVEPRSPRKINPAIPVDLETIVLQAMSKSRERRYATARDLADDLKRFLAGEATVARRPTVLDRSAKWVQRHRKMAAIAGLFFVCVTLLSTVGAFLLAREQARTKEALRRAEEHYQLARDVVDRFGGQYADQLAALPGSEPVRQAVLQDTLAYYQQFIEHAMNDPSLKAELATTFFKSAVIATRLGARAEAETAYREAMAIFDELAQDPLQADDSQMHRATCLNNLGLLYAAQGKTDAADDAYGAAIRLGTELVAKDRDRDDVARLLAEIYGNRAILERHLGRIDEARRSFSQSVDLLSGLVERSPDEQRYAHDLAINYNNLSFVEREADWNAAERFCRQAIAILEGLTEEGSDETAYPGDLALCYNNLGAIQSNQGDVAAACASYRRAIAVQEQLCRQAPAVVLYRSELAVSLNNLGQALAKTGDLVAADEAFGRARALFTELVDDYPDEITYQSALAGVLNNQAMSLEQAGREDEAIDAYQQAIAHQRQAFDRAPQVTQYREFLSKHLFNYGRLLRAANKPEEAAETALQRRDLWAGDGEHLYQVAIELAQAADGMDSETYRNEAVQTLQQAIEVGLVPPEDLTQVEAFQSLRENATFQEMTAGLAHP